MRAAALSSTFPSYFLRTTFLAPPRRTHPHRRHAVLPDRSEHRAQAMEVPAGLEGLPLLPIDPTKTGDSEKTEHLRETLQEVR